MDGFPPDDGRLAELILYVSDRCADWDDFDPVVLDRILFQADFSHYRECGVPITGQAYRRGPSGPTPRGLARVLRGLAREFAVLEIPLGDDLHVRRRPLARREARLALFGPRELALVDDVMRHYRTTWGPARPEAPSSDYLAIPWELAAPRELIPYAWALLAPGPGQDLETTSAAYGAPA
jgi:hypothetical protein